MSLLAVLVIVGFGLAIGLLSGLVGIGGGVLIVPFLYFFYDHPELFGVLAREDARVLLAHGTSLFVIVPTSVRGVQSFQRAGLVEWRAVWPIGLISIAAAVAGARLALEIPPGVLKLSFGVLLIASAIRMVMRREAPQEGAPPPPAPRLSLPVTISIGIIVGTFSALMGVGGGIIAIPLLVYLARIDIRRVAGTSIGIIALTAAAGTLSYVWTGMGEPGLPSWSAGYVHLPAGLAMFVGSVASVHWGAALNQRLRPRTLTLVFAALFVLVGLRLVVQNLNPYAG